MRVNSLNSLKNYSVNFSKLTSNKTRAERRKETTQAIFTNIVNNFNDHLIHYKEKVQIRDFMDKPVNAVVLRTGKNSRTIQCNGIDVGNCVFSESKAKISGENYPEFYKNKPYLFINSITSNKQFKGIGTELVRSIVKESKRLGYEGRVCLNASVINPELGSPIPFYSKLGFEASDINKQLIIDYTAKNDLPLPENCQSATMFLTKDGIERLLSH